MTAVTHDLIVPFNTHARVAFAATVGDACVARIPDAVELTNHVGTVHAGALFTVAEAASGCALMETVLSHALKAGLDPAACRAVVRDARIQFRKPARGEMLAHAHVLTPATQCVEELLTLSKSTASVSVKVKDRSGVVVAEMQVEWHLARVQPKDAGGTHGDGRD